MGSPKQLDQFDQATQDAIKSWWRANEEELHGSDVVADADSNDNYLKIINLGYEQDGEIVGVAVGKCSLGLAYLHELIVDEQYRGQGIGTVLLNEFEQVARNHDCHRMALRTQSAKAARFYEQNGWTIEFTSPDWFAGNPCMNMRKSLALN